MGLSAAAAGKLVVLGEVWRLGTALGEVFEFVGGGLGDVLLEPARVGARLQDSLDAIVLQGAIAERVRERLEQVRCVVCPAQKKYVAGMVASRAWQAFLEGGKEGGGGLTELCEGAAQLIEVRSAVGMRRPVTGQDRALLSTATTKLVSRDAGQVGLVDEELVLGDAHWQDLGDIIVGQRVPVAFPGDEALDVA